MFASIQRIHFTITAIFLAACLSLPAAALTAEASCDSRSPDAWPTDAWPADAWPVAAGETFRHIGGDVGDAVCVTIDLPSAGLLATEVVTPIGASRARLHVVSAPSHRQHRASASAYLLEGAEGRYQLRVQAENPKAALPPFRLQTRTVAAAESVDPLYPDKNETDSEIEIDPPPADPTSGNGSTEDPGTSGTGSGETDSEIEIDPPPALRSVATLDRPDFDLLCKDGRDDHADDFWCSSALERHAEVAAVLDNPWGDDRDTFSFQLDSLETIEFHAASEIDLCAELVDADGQRLDVRWSRQSQELQAFATLVAGRYALRLESCDGAQGEYRLTLDVR